MSQSADKTGTKTMHEHRDTDAPISESSVSLKLSLIQQRCTELLEDSDGLGLSLEDTDFSSDGSDPYNSGR
jgi:hypothetical protein